MKIKVLGSGCTNCHKLHEETLKAVKETGKDIEVEYITDIKVMLGYGIISGPALMFDDKVISQGRVLKAKEIETLIEKAV